MKQFLKIEVSGKIEWLNFEQEEEYSVLSEAVGGYIEMVPSVIKDHYLYVNEEGKLLMLEINDAATQLANLPTLDLIVGNAVLVGPIDEDGNHLSVDRSAVEENSLLRGAAND